MPFVLRRAALLVRFVRANRDRPALDELARLDEPEEFIWAILPHAARTFAACIALMPRKTVLPCAVAYLYCRMLDTYEDLVPDRREREAALRAFADRLSASAERLGPARPIDAATVQDERDRAHLLLVQKAALVDKVFTTLDAETRGIIKDLVVAMADGMCWSSATFAAQGGVLTSREQLSEYCRHVLGNPTVFGIRILRLAYGRPTTLTSQEREDAMLVGEFVQLANVTRDIEKDLGRGIAYDAELKSDLGRNAREQPWPHDRDLRERIRAARERLLHVALSRADAYRRAIDSIGLPERSIARAAAVLMMLFTESYFSACARRVGMQSWKAPNWTPGIILRALPASISPRQGRRELQRAEQELLAAAARQGRPLPAHA